MANLIVSASHIDPRWQLDAVAFTIDVHSSYRVSGDDERGYYAIAPNFGCGRHCSTPERAIRSLLESNGCTGITITAEPQPDQGAAVQTIPANATKRQIAYFNSRTDEQIAAAWIALDSDRVKTGKNKADWLIEAAALRGLSLPREGETLADWNARIARNAEREAAKAAEPSSSD